MDYGPHFKINFSPHTLSQVNPKPDVRRMTNNNKVIACHCLLNHTPQETNM